MAYLQIEKFNKTFSDGFKVLKDISFSLDKGQVLSIIGSSGSGKTTLLRCLNFLEMADEGKIILNNDTLFDAETDKQLRFFSFSAMIFLTAITEDSLERTIFKSTFEDM